MRNALIAFAFLSIAGLAVGRTEFVNSIPNTANVVANDSETQSACQTCHVSATNGGPRNSFGLQVEANMKDGAPDWRAIFGLDADSDGSTNGQELGDPNGTWTRGSVNPGSPSTITHPAKYSSHPQTILPGVTPTAWGLLRSVFK